MSLKMTIMVSGREKGDKHSSHSPKWGNKRTGVLLRRSMRKGSGC
jgi:hypothetical protein